MRRGIPGTPAVLGWQMLSMGAGENNAKSPVHTDRAPPEWRGRRDSFRTLLMAQDPSIEALSFEVSRLLEGADI